MTPDEDMRINRDTIILKVPADVPDIRDRMYDPALIMLPDKIQPELSELKIRNQLREGACTGFSLTSAIDLLNKKRGRNEVEVSARMLYEMAQRFDEWAGEDYEGSSLRGAIRGWWHNGVCQEATWPYQTDQQPGVLTVKRAKEARSNTLGAYYRLRPNITDFHAALAETGVICVSAKVHQGWFDPLDSEGRIEKKQRINNAAHAFALVGYNLQGFIIQNSWGEKWGNRGTAIWTYEDWSENVMDAWVFRLALPVPQVFSLRAGRESSGPANRDEWFGWFRGSTRREEIAGHFAHIDDGKFHETGQYHSRVEDVVETATNLANSTKYKHLIFYAHGGLNDPKGSASRIRGMKDVFKENRIYPFHFMYDTGLFEELKDVITNKNEQTKTQVGDFFGQSDRIIENKLRRIGALLWEEMKIGGKKAFDSNGAGVSTLKVFKEYLAENNVKIHLVGHSAGAILLAHLIEAADQLDISIESCNLMAPACTVELFDSHYKTRIGTQKLKILRIYNLSEEREQDDNVAFVYRKSLLYLVSNAFEQAIPGQGKPILGMQKHSTKLDTHQDLSIFYSGEDSSSITSSKSHGGFDNDVATMNNILKTILGDGTIVREFNSKDLNF